MRRPRIAVIGDTALIDGELTDAGAIATELALLDRADVGFRSVAADRIARERLEARFGRTSVTTWLTVREHDAPEADGSPHADLRMGDPIDIAEIFDHDVVVLGCRDVRLRRFLADLPVHTRPDVRILVVLHFEDGVPDGERVEDVLRFDTIIGSEIDFQRWGASSDLHITTDGDAAVMARLHRRMHGTNVRALLSWAEDGAATLAEPLENIVTVPAGHAPATPGSTSWAAFVAAVALGMAERQPYPEIARLAAGAFARRAQELHRSD